ncbi:hypothetical protein QTP88_027809 [Uroleucon formosanum]
MPGLHGSIAVERRSPHDNASIPIETINGLHVQLFLGYILVESVHKMSSTVRVGLLLICDLLREELLKFKSKKTKKRRLWTRKWILRRNTLGASTNLLKELSVEDPKSFYNHLKMNEDMFLYLLKKVFPYIQKENTNMREALPARLKLEIVLRFLATGDSFASLSALYRVPKCTISCFLLDVLEAIYKALENFIKVPSTENEWKKIQNDFNIRWNFLLCCGAIDGKHVLIRNPPNGVSNYFNYKGTYSVVLLAAVDANYCFIYIDVGANGCMNDASIFNNSSLNEAISTNQLHLPKNAVFVADDAFPLRTNILKPYSRIGRLSHKQKIFNYRLSRARRIVENAFGILVSKFRIFEKPISTSLDKTDSIIRATCALHNWLRTTATKYINIGMVDTENLEDGSITSGSWRANQGNQGMIDISRNIGSNNHSKEAAEIRDKYAEYFVGFGAVPWQNQMIY